MAEPDNDRTPKPPDDYKLAESRRWMKYIFVGKLFLLPILVLTSAGYFLDRLLHLAVGFSVLGLISGFFLGMWLLIRTERALIQEADEQRAEKLRQESGEPDDPGEE